MAEASAPSLLDRYVAAVLRHRWPVVALATLLMLAMTAGAPSITVTNDYRILFSDDNPQLIAYNALENTYAVSNRALIAVAPRDGSVFTQETLGSIVELTDAAWQAPYSSRVDSLTNYSHSEAFGEDDLIVAPLVEDASGLSDADLARIEAIALDASDIAGRLISYDGRVAGVAINFVLPENPDLAVIEITDYLNAVLDEARASHPGIDYHTTGDVVMNRTFSDATQSDIQTLTPIVFLIIVVATVVLLRSVFATVAVVAVLMFAINTTMGFAGWRGVVFSPTNAGVPIIVMVVAVADSIHIVTTALLGMRRGLDRHAAIVESFRVNSYPIFLTSLTTAIGFLSLNASDSPPFHVLGNYVAFGVVAAFAYTMTLLPALLALLPLRPPRVQAVEPAFFDRFYDRFADFVIARRTLLLWSTTVAVVVLMTGIPRIELSDNMTQYFDDRYQFRRDSDFIAANLTGLDRLEYSLDTGREGGITDPEYLRNVDGFAEWYREQPEVSYVQSFPDIIKRLNKNMNGDDPAFYRLPESAELAAQFLLLYELSLPFGSDLNDRIDIGKSAHAHGRRNRQRLVPGAAGAGRARAGLAARQRPGPGKRGVGRQRHVRPPVAAQHQQHARRHDFRNGAHLVHPDFRLQERTDRSHQPPAELHTRPDELRPVGLSRGPRRHCVFGGRRRRLRDSRGRHHSFPERLPESAARRAWRAGGRAHRVPYGGPCAVHDDRRPLGRFSGFRLVGVRGELGARNPGDHDDHPGAGDRLPPAANAAARHRSEGVVRPADC